MHGIWWVQPILSKRSTPRHNGNAKLGRSLMRTSKPEKTSWYPGQSDLQTDIFREIFGIFFGLSGKMVSNWYLLVTNLSLRFFVEKTTPWILYFNNSLLYEAATTCILQTSFICKMETFATNHFSFWKLRGSKSREWGKLRESHMKNELDKYIRSP